MVKIPLINKLTCFLLIFAERKRKEKKKEKNRSTGAFLWLVIILNKITSIDSDRTVKNVKFVDNFRLDKCSKMKSYCQ